MIARPRVLVVDTFSGLNDYGVSIAYGLAKVTDLTFLTVADTRIAPTIPCRLLPDIPQWGGKLGKLAKARAFARYLVVLTRELWRHRLDTVHIQLFRMEGVDIWVYILMRPFLRRIVYSAHNVYPHERKWWHRPLYQLWYRLVDQIHVLGEYSAGMLRQMGVEAGRIHLIPHGDYSLFRSRHPPAPPEGTRASLGVTDADVIVLIYGLLREYKGLQRLVDAFCLLPADSRAFLVVAGGGDRSLLDAAERTLAAHGRQHRASLRFGHLPDQDLADLIEASDVVVFPYTHIYQSGALMLAMTYGKPVIASDIQGFRDYLQGHSNGVLMDTGSAKLLAAAIEDLSIDPPRREAMKIEALRRCATEFSWDNIAARMTGLYE